MPTDKTLIAQIYPADARDALIQAAARGDHIRIDYITDALARQDFCRPRKCESMAHIFDQRRALREAICEGATV